MILVDAGPLVALIHADDRHHASCKEALRKVPEALGTVWPAFTEAMYLLGFSSKAPRMRDLMRKYKDLPMDLADAALVRVAEREKLPRIFTIDRRDFEVYR